MICIYEADCSDFSGNSLGALTPLECSVTETLNGEWELTCTELDFNSIFLNNLNICVDTLNVLVINAIKHMTGGR